MTDDAAIRYEDARATVDRLRADGDLEGLTAVALDDRVHSLIRFRAAQAVRRDGTDRVDCLSALLTSADPAVRAAATRALGSSKDPRAIACLREALDDRTEGVVAWAIDGLGRLREGSAVPILISKLESSNWQIAGASARALGRIGDRRAIPALESLKRRTHLSRRLLVKIALWQLKRADAVDRSTARGPRR